MLWDFPGGFCCEAHLKYWIPLKLLLDLTKVLNLVFCLIINDNSNNNNFVNVCPCVLYNMHELNFSLKYVDYWILWSLGNYLLITSEILLFWVHETVLQSVLFYYIECVKLCWNQSCFVSVLLFVEKDWASRRVREFDSIRKKEVHSSSG